MWKWDERFLSMAKLIASWSKDPSTKCGSVIAKDRRVVSLGFNGFAPGVSDHESRYFNRATKYLLVLHAEENAVLSARTDMTGCTCYVWPMPPCSNCMARLIQAGITRVVCPKPTPEQEERWGESFKAATLQAYEAGVELTFAEGEVL